MKKAIVMTQASAVHRSIAEILGGAFTVDRAASIAPCLDLIDELKPSVLFVDLNNVQSESAPGDSSGFLRICASIRRATPSISIIIVAPRGDVSAAVAAVRAGADSYVTLPLNDDELRHVVDSAGRGRQLKTEESILHEPLLDGDVNWMLKTKSSHMLGILEKVRMVAPTETTVLLAGETGTGKGIIARLIHEMSRRRDRRFVNVHCGAIPETLIESELFGHERGAFTGAIRRKLGQFEVASAGTIFLDEIGTVTVATQIKLLQVLQDHTIQPVGAERPIACNVRVIAASNNDLEAMCGRGEFRNDLYYRLNVFPVFIPPLRERCEDIPLFIDYFIKKFNAMNRREIEGASREVMDAFIRYRWPGNIRELENLIQRAFIIETSKRLTRKSFPQELFTESIVEDLPPKDLQRLSIVRRKAVEEAERSYLAVLLAKTRGRIGVAADLAGITRRRLHKLLSQYGIRKEDFKQR